VLLKNLLCECKGAYCFVTTCLHMLRPPFNITCLTQLDETGYATFRYNRQITRSPDCKTMTVYNIRTGKKLTQQTLDHYWFLMVFRTRCSILPMMFFPECFSVSHRSGEWSETPAPKNMSLLFASMIVFSFVSISIRLQS
jgi:hypothetical protein